MSKKRLGIFKKMARGDVSKNDTKGDRHRLWQVRQMSAMVLWLLVKILDRSSLFMFRGRSTALDEKIQDVLREAVKSAMETERLILWCCNAAELETEEETNDETEKHDHIVNGPGGGRVISICDGS